MTNLSKSSPVVVCNCAVRKNCELNQAFLATTDAKTKEAVLTAIANHYGITCEQAEDEVTHDEAEHLLDYLTGEVRTATSVLMRRRGLEARG